MVNPAKIPAPIRLTAARIAVFVGPTKSDNQPVRDPQIRYPTVPTAPIVDITEALYSLGERTCSSNSSITLAIV